METNSIQTLFDVSGKVVVVTGGAGVLCSSICKALAAAGACIAVLDLNSTSAGALAADICSSGGEAIGVTCNVLDRASVESALIYVEEHLGSVDILINGAGGNKPQATTNPEQRFFDLPAEALQWVFNLNLLGTILPSQVFGRSMAARASGIILNISSMNAFRPLTRIPAYSAAKAGVSNFTQWLAVHMAQDYSPNIRVNAIAPGFFVGDQNRRLLYNEDNTLTSRGQSILGHTPMARFGLPADLFGTIFWLLSPASAFVTGIVVPVDGGFSAFSGV
jgi:NAD(P)-dependent dehydrogenase (short-subunit alcohol dehydrogenase family)